MSLQLVINANNSIPCRA